MSDGDVVHHHFLWLSDVHFDPYYATPKAFAADYADAGCSSEKSPSVGKYGCDSPPRLVQSALQFAQEVASDSPPTFVVVSGDSIRHGVDQLFTGGEFQEGGEAQSKNATAAESAVHQAAHAPFHNEAVKTAGDILHTLVTKVKLAFPGSEVIVSVGNNDVVPDYYLALEDEDETLGSSELTSERTGMLGEIFKRLKGVTKELLSGTNYTEMMTPEDEGTFLRGGYYSRTLHDGALTVLSLNTVLYSSYFLPLPQNVEDPGRQFAWMRNVLKQCEENGSQVIIVGHIPPAVGSFRHTQLWKERYIQTYYDIVRDYDDVIIGQLYGHLHSDEFRVGLSDSAVNTTMIPAMKSPLLLAGSVTPLHGNDPSIRLVKYGLGGDAGYRLLDYESYKMSMSGYNWSKLYRFSRAYGVYSDIAKEKGLSSEAFTSILESMEDTMGKESPVMEQYRSFMLSGADGDEGKSSKGSNVQCNATCRDEVICTFISATRPGYDNCLLERSPAWSQNGRAILGLIGAAVFSAMLVSFVVVRQKRRSKRDDYETASSVGDDVQHEPIDRADTNTGDQEMI